LLTWETHIEAFLYKIEGNIGSTEDPIWITVADEIDAADSNFNGKTNLSLLKNTWLEAKKGAK